MGINYNISVIQTVLLQAKLTAQRITVHSGFEFLDLVHYLISLSLYLTYTKVLPLTVCPPSASGAASFRGSECDSAL